MENNKEKKYDDMQLVQGTTVIKRIIHWSFFFAIINNIVTGFYIAYPFLIFGKSPTQVDSISKGVLLHSGETNQAFIMTWMINFHLIGALVIIIVFVIGLYLAFFSTVKPLHKSLLPFRDKADEAWRMFKYSFTLKNKPPSRQYQEPLNAFIFTIFHLLTLVIILTGLQMYVSSFTGTSAIGSWWPWLMHFSTDWTLVIFGGLTGVTLVHLFMMWLTIIFIAYHIYTEVWRSIMWKEGDIMLMFGGYKYINKKESE